MRFDTPLWLLASAVVALGLLVHFVSRQAGGLKRPAILFSALPAVLRRRPTWRIRLRRVFGVVRILALLALIVALARPQRGRSDSVILSEGIDIMMVVDTSGSMAAEDFGAGKTRLYHATKVMGEFAQRREADRIGLISFGLHAYTRCPMTLDHALLDEFFEHVLSEWERANDSLARKVARGRRDVRLTPQEENLQGTAIGDALVTAVSRLEESDAKSRVVVLLTDGSSNAGETEPAAGAELARQLGIKIYTVGAGSNKVVPVTVYDRLGNRVKTGRRFPLDEETLENIADTTGGRYFHARSREGLEEVYDEIDRLERSELKTKDYREWDERFQPLAWAALALLLLEALIAATVLRTIP